MNGKKFLLQFFEYEHLPPNLKAVSMPFCEVAKKMSEVLKDNPEAITCLRKLLEAKDCAVRSELAK